MRIVVIGATGNVGTGVLRRLHRARADSGDTLEIVGVARRRPNTSVTPYSDVEWHSIDVSADDAVARLTTAFEGADAVIHLAWALQPNRDEPAMRRTNVGGTVATLAAVEAAGVPHVVVASSVGAYSSGPKDRRVDESWPTGGLHTSHYSRHKAMNERALDAFEERHPQTIVSRLRPGLVFQSGAGEELVRLFLGPLIPTGWMGKLALPFVPLPAPLISQAVHSDDLADAFWRVVEQRAAGAFNIAAEPTLGPPQIADALRARRILTISLRSIRAVVQATHALRLQRTDVGWVDIAAHVPIMSIERAHTELGWTAAVSSTAALAEVVAAVASRKSTPGSPPLAEPV